MGDTINRTWWMAVPFRKKGNRGGTDLKLGFGVCAEETAGQIPGSRDGKQP